MTSFFDKGTSTTNVIIGYPLCIRYCQEAFHNGSRDEGLHTHVFFDNSGFFLVTSSVMTTPQEMLTHTYRVSRHQLVAAYIFPYILGGIKDLLSYILFNFPSSDLQYLKIITSTTFTPNAKLTRILYCENKKSYSPLFNMKLFLASWPQTWWGLRVTLNVCFSKMSDTNKNHYFHP